MKSRRRFTFAWFWLVFWLTVIATILLSWSMLVADPIVELPSNASPSPMVFR